MASIATITAIGNLFTANGVTAGNQDTPTVTETGNNSFYVTYLDHGVNNDPSGIIQQTAFDSNGVRSTLLKDHTIGTAGLLAPNSGRYKPRGAPDTGQSMLTWFAPVGPQIYVVMAEVFNPDGTVATPAFQVSAPSAKIDTALKAAFSVATNGNVMITWTLQGNADSSGRAAVAQIFDPSLNPVGSQFQVNTTTLHDQRRPRPIGLPDGNFEVFFASADTTSSSYNIRARIFDPTGGPVSVNGSSSDFIINTTASTRTTQPSYQRAGLGNGQSVVTWESTDPADTSGVVIRYRLLDQHGMPIGTDQVVNTNDIQVTSPSVRSLADGRAIFVWEGKDASSLAHFYGRIMNADGSWAQDSETTLTPGSVETSLVPFDVASLLDGRFAITWQGDNTSDGDGKGIKAQIFVPTVSGDVVVTAAAGTTVTGGAGTNWITGDPTSATTLVGGTGTNHLFGGNADDTLVAGTGTGTNTLIGGGGSNTFVLGDTANIKNAVIAGGTTTAAGSATFDAVNTLELTPTTNVSYDFTTATITDVNAITFNGTKIPNDPALVFASSQFGVGLLAIDTLFTFDLNIDSVTINDATPENATTIDTSHFRFASLDATKDTFTIDAHTATASVTEIGLSAAIDTTFLGGSGDDTFTGGAGSDTFDGGAGVDTVVYHGNRSQYTIQGTTSAFTVTDGVSNRDASDSLRNIEYVRFADGTVSVPDLFNKPSERVDNPNDLTYAGTAFGATHFIDLLNLEASYDDLSTAFGTDQTSMESWYATYQPTEQRPTTFDGLQYIASYSDLISAFGSLGSLKAIEDAGATHNITYGKTEGRKTTFNGLDYIDSYDDLISTFGSNSDSGALHYIQYGSKEGRSITFDGLEYIASYSDLIHAFGTDEQAGAAHFATYGVTEHRSRASFNAVQYIANYGDLRTAFGSDQHSAITHFITYGLTEGRTDRPLT